ncbi:MAG: CoA transferase, partial [Dehalococcoidia bacterium]|nr:CoA transferase [Dehalococcoidia bacterium]
ALIGDERFADYESVAQHADDIEEIMSDWTRKHTKHEAMKILAGAGVLAGATMNSNDLLEDEQMQARNMVVSVEDDVRGDYTMLGCPIKLSDQDDTVTRAPLYGEHNKEVLTTILGCTPDEVEQMREQGVIG